MTIDEYVKEKDLPEMKVLGELKNFRYYIEKHLTDEEVGIPMIIEENKINRTFKICDSNQALAAMGLF